MTLDEAERDAIEQIERLRREFEVRARPFVEIISRIRLMRPRTYYVRDGGKLLEIVPFDIPELQDSGIKADKAAALPPASAPKVDRTAEAVTGLGVSHSHEV